MITILVLKQKHWQLKHTILFPITKLSVTFSYDHKNILKISMNHQQT